MDGKALGKAMGLLWAGAVVVLGLTAREGWGEEWHDLLSDVYLGYDSTNQGLVIGAIWAFADGFVGAYLLAWLYNLFQPSEK
ncbi:putative membrane protein (plasmid) [Halapricum desulfuricans]|uniref:Putative membrane protein n=1 Tax=Halapricum desulfuricans TaxID=2841257 RepID=A0A897NL75_9EURY|nr:putative membrane protein [Halapricum desulfuricans]